MGSLLRLASFVLCAFVLGSFVLFAVAQTSHASHTQISALNGADPNSTGPAPHEHQPRRFIDQVAHDLNSPWEGVVASHSAWVVHLVPTAISLLVYGFGLGFLSRWAAAPPT